MVLRDRRDAGAPTGKARRPGDDTLEIPKQSRSSDGPGRDRSPGAAIRPVLAGAQRDGAGRNESY